MSYSSSLIDIVDPLVLDTSALVNLHASKHGGRILGAIPNEVIIPNTVVVELEHETSRKNGENAFVHALVADGRVTLANLTEKENGVFHDLTSRSPSLDDGEAATIAIALTRQFLPVIDERKGRTRFSILVEARTPAWSLDLLRHPAAISVLGPRSAVDALYLALRDGRMRIPFESADDVIALIGLDRSRDCT